jgi:hypothetical protein
MALAFLLLIHKILGHPAPAHPLNARMQRVFGERFTTTFSAKGAEAESATFDLSQTCLVPIKSILAGKFLRRLDAPSFLP